MTQRRIVILTIGLAVAAFAIAGYFYNRNAPAPEMAVALAENSTLVRPASPVIGPADAKVTIVEFFDPACESCRAFHPTVKQILAEHRKDVRLVLRYAPLHDGSEEAVRILEAARLQGKFKPVMEALLDAQPVWASHSAPNLGKAWEAASKAGLDEARARRDAAAPEIDAILRQDIADMAAIRLKGTPTFFVNGKQPPRFGKRELADFVRAEVQAVR